MTPDTPHPTHIEWVPPGARTSVTVAFDDAVALPVHRADPVRHPPVYKGQRHYPGWHYSTTDGRHLVYESWFERDHLRLIDFDTDVVALATQPFRLHWPAGYSPGSHVPDVAIRHRDGATTVLDIRPTDHVAKDADVFAATEAACAAVGWGYEVRADPDPTLLGNVRWLIGYASPSAAYDRHRADLLVAAVDPIDLDVLHDAVGGTCVARATIFHLLWTRALVADLVAAPLDGATRVMAS